MFFIVTPNRDQLNRLGELVGSGRLHVEIAQSFRWPRGARRSTRMFLPRPVSRRLVQEALELAMCAPSNSNVQPWHVVFTSGAARDRLVAAMLERA